MFSSHMQRLCALLICQLLVATTLLFSAGLTAWAQDAVPAQGGDGVTLKICRPETCFGTEQAKQDYAERND